jgi:DNA repair protein RadA/Sms
MKTQCRPITQIAPQDTTKISLGVPDIDSILSGGFTKGQCIMLAGQPGCGKSTLITQVTNILSQKGNKILYVSGEESLPQIRTRADRLGAVNDNIICAEATGLEVVIQLAELHKPQFMVVDSLQMIHSAMLKQAPSSPSQMRFCLDKLIDYAKANDVVLLVIGHSTKTGIIAGLLALQHMVDTVLFMTTDITNVRKIQVYKNRYGEANIATELTMDKNGFREFAKATKPLFTLSVPAAEKLTQTLEASSKEERIVRTTFKIAHSIFLAMAVVLYGTVVYMVKVMIELPGALIKKPKRR